jgi:hypothetical protein
MNETSILLNAPGTPGAEICVSVNEFAQAMGAAQASIITSAGQAMLTFFFVGIAVGAAFTYLWLYSKKRIEEAEESREDDP